MKTHPLPITALVAFASKQQIVMSTKDVAPKVFQVVRGVDPWALAWHSGLNMATVLWMEMIQKIPFVSVKNVIRFNIKLKMFCSYGKVHH